MKIVLIGFATAYKSTVGKLLSQRLNISLYDVDQLIEKQANQSVAQIFATYGEELFRSIENTTLSSLALHPHCVVACGGGSVLCPHFEKIRQNATVVWLQVDAPTVQSRLDGSTRPLFDNLTFEELSAKIAERNAIYQCYCDYAIDSVGKTAQQVLDELLTVLHKA